MPMRSAIMPAPAPATCLLCFSTIVRQAWQTHAPASMLSYWPCTNDGFPSHVQRDFVRKRGAAAATAPPRLPPADGGISSSTPGSSRSAGGNASAAGAAAGSAAAEVVPAVPGGVAVGSDGEEERRLLEGMELVMRTVRFYTSLCCFPPQLCACARLGNAGPALRPSMRSGPACAPAQLEGRGWSQRSGAQCARSLSSQPGRDEDV